jgi:peptidoglycan/xylan/chitin deacetylase (PgdA/CDA1 family)
LYLTFDDGPHPLHTRQILRLLQQHDAKATFFMIGQTLRVHRDVAREVHSAGHRLANHSTTHPWFHRIPKVQQRDEIAATEAELAAIDGRTQHWFRPPHGRLSVHCAAEAVRGRLPLALWSTDSLDYRLSSDAVVSHLLGAGVRGGDILLFHDDAPVSAQALEQLLPKWRAQGLRCAALP